MKEIGGSGAPRGARGAKGRWGSAGLSLLLPFAGLLGGACSGEPGGPAGALLGPLPEQVGPPAAPGEPGRPYPGEPVEPVYPVGPGPERPLPEPTPSIAVGSEPVGAVEECDIDQLSAPQVYGNKVKTLLTGLPLDEAELTALRGSPDALPGLVGIWLARPEFDAVLAGFFQTAFQQNGEDPDGLSMMLRRTPNFGRFSRPTESVVDLFRANIRESFARTALEIVKTGRPFSEVATTDTYQMTTALLVFHAFLEHRYVNDRNQVRQVAMPEVRDFVLYRNAADAPPAEDALDPSNSRFLHLYVPGFDSLCVPAGDNTLTVQENAFNGNDEIYFLFSVLVGRPDTLFNRAANQGRSGNPCRAGNANAEPLLSRADFEDWRPVRLRPLGLGEETTRFYHLSRLRRADEIAVRSERVGFFTTLGFFTSWPTNQDNQSRVTINQALITALGASFEGETVTDFSPPNLDAEHSAPGTACFGCHQTLDPMRDYFRRSFSYHYGIQDDAAMLEGAEPHFVFRGVRTTGNGVRDLGTVLAEHPDFPRAWVQKLCFFANAAPCPEDTDPFRQVVSDFVTSGLDFRVMLRSLLSSPLVTHTACVDGGTGHVRSISRKDQLCAQLSGRLGIEDICGDTIHPSRRSTLQREVASAIASIPEDTFARGEPDPVVISQTGLFTRAIREVACTTVAERAYAEVFGGRSRDEATLDMVTRVMGLPVGDPRHAEALSILRSHVEDGVARGASETVALQSALVVACMSPGIAGIGF